MRERGIEVTSSQVLGYSGRIWLKLDLIHLISEKECVHGFLSDQLKSLQKGRYDAY